MDTRQIVAVEVKLINRLLSQHGIKAGTLPKLAIVVRSSFIAYGLKLGPGEKASRIEAISRELSNELTNQPVRRCVRRRARPLRSAVHEPSTPDRRRAHRGAALGPPQGAGRRARARDRTAAEQPVHRRLGPAVPHD